MTKIDWCVRGVIVFLMIVLFSMLLHTNRIRSNKFDFIKSQIEACDTILFVDTNTTSIIGRYHQIECDSIQITFIYDKPVKFSYDKTGINRYVVVGIRGYTLINYDNEFKHLRTCEHVEILDLIKNNN